MRTHAIYIKTGRVCACTHARQFSKYEIYRQTIFLGLISQSFWAFICQNRFISKENMKWMVKCPIAHLKGPTVHTVLLIFNNQDNIGHLCGNACDICWWFSYTKVTLTKVKTFQKNTSAEDITDSRVFTENRALSVSSFYQCVTSCKKSKKSL